MDSEWKAGTGQTIDKMYVWIATEPDGGEGVIGILTVDGWSPLVGADGHRMESLRPYAKMVAEKSGRPIELVEFSVRRNLGAP